MEEVFPHILLWNRISNNNDASLDSLLKTQNHNPPISHILAAQSGDLEVLDSYLLYLLI